MGISVIIPVYNSEEILPILIKRLAPVLPSLADTYELILVNDGSQDQSWDIIQDISRQHPWITGVNLTRNYGQHNAILCGVRHARQDICITMDDDLQHMPEEIHLLLEKLAEGFDVVYGVPRRPPHSWWRNLGSILSKLTVSLVIGSKTVRTISSFRAFRRSLANVFDQFAGSEVILDALLAWGTRNFSFVYVEEVPRPIGKSNYSLVKLIGVAMAIITSFSTLPLRVSSIMGFTLTLLGLFIFIYVIGVSFIAGSIPGFPFLASIILIFSGGQLFSLGILGEYLARIFERTSGRKPYVVATTTRDQGLSEQH